MKETDEAQTRLYTYTTELFKAHEKLLADYHRNRAFYAALKKHVTPESVVLDIGSGTGIWAVVAAVLGAKRVVAVERDPLLIGLIKALARENGVADRVEALAAESRQILLDREFDIVVSEMIGHLAFEEDITPILTDARERFLKPGGVLIPQSVALVVAGAHLRPRHKSIPAGVPIRSSQFQSLNIHTPVGLEDRSRLRLATEPRELVSADLRTLKTMPDLTDLTARWDLEDASRLNCFVVWMESTLTEGVELTSIRTSHWTPLIYRVEPFAAKGGLLEFQLTLEAATNYWTATLSSGDHDEKQSYSPAFAGSLLLAQSRTEDDLLNSPQRMSFVGASKT